MRFSLFHIGQLHRPELGLGGSMEHLNKKTKIIYFPRRMIIKQEVKTYIWHLTWLDCWHHRPQNYERHRYRCRIEICWPVEAPGSCCWQLHLRLHCASKAFPSKKGENVKAFRPNVWQWEEITYISPPSNLVWPWVGTYITFKIDIISLFNIWSIEWEAKAQNCLRYIWKCVRNDF